MHPDHLQDQPSKPLWVGELHLREYDAYLHLLNHPDKRLEAIQQVFDNRHELMLACQLGKLRDTGPLSILQERLARHTPWAVRCLLMAQLANALLTKTIASANQLLVSPRYRAFVQLADLPVNRRATLFTLYHQDPTLLVAIQSLDRWMRRGSTHYLLSHTSVPKAGALAHFLHPRRFGEWLSQRTHLHLERTYTSSPSDHTLVMSRRLRLLSKSQSAGYEQSAEGESKHPWYFMRLSDDGVALSLPSPPLDSLVKLATDIVTSVYNLESSYIVYPSMTADDVVSSFLQAIHDPAEPRMSWVSAILNAPAGHPPSQIHIRRDDPNSEQVFDDLDRLEQLTIRYQENAFNLTFPEVDGVRTTQFVPSEDCPAPTQGLIAFCYEQFGVFLSPPPDLLRP